MTTENQKATKKSTKIILIIALIALVIGGFFGIRFYATYFAPNVTDAEKHLYIKTGSTYEQLVSELRTKNILNDIDAFERAALKMNLKSRIKPGKYRLEKGMGNRALINKLKSGNQEPVSFKFHNIRKKENFAAYLGKNLETDSLTFIHYLDSAAFASQYGFNTETFYTMFIPNTYEFYWNVAPKDFFDRMHKEYEKFWNADRKAKAEKLGLTPAQVTTLASIVDSEALFDREMRTIAGLYLNRLEKGILLQADPTVIFANNDFSVRRVTGKLLAIDSKYNTYKYAGLPPGPITMPSINAIDAVLNREQNNYIYMCAKEDFSGYHNFAVTKAEHEVNAKKYREALNQRNIFR